MLHDLRSLDEVTLAAFDLETTGLFPFLGRIVEVAAVRGRLGEAQPACFAQLVNPGIPIPADARRVHGISDAMVRDQPAVGAVLPHFLDFLGPADTLLLAHNARFDLGFLGVALSEIGRPRPPFAVEDTAELARALCPALPSYRLEAVAAALGIPGAQDHRALPDARLAFAVLSRLLARDRRIHTVADLAQRTAFLRFSDGDIHPIAPPPGLEELAVAIERGCAGMMVYAGGSKGLHPRRVTPRALVSWRGTAYLRAYCHTDGTEKTYKLSQVQHFSLEIRG